MTRDKKWSRYIEKANWQEEFREKYEKKDVNEKVLQRKKKKLNEIRANGKINKRKEDCQQ